MSKYKEIWYKNITQKESKTKFWVFFICDKFNFNMFDIIYISDHVQVKCFGCEKWVWFRDTVKYFNVSCVHKRAEVPQICYCFRQKYIPERWGWGALDFWVCWDCCENDTIFFLKCFIGGQKLSFLYISPIYLRCKKILALRQSRNAKFRFRCHFQLKMS